MYLLLQLLGLIPLNHSVVIGQQLPNSCSVKLVASGRCMPSAADKGWDFPKRPYSTVSVISLSVSTEVSPPFCNSCPITYLTLHSETAQIQCLFYKGLAAFNVLFAIHTQTTQNMFCTSIHTFMTLDKGSTNQLWHPCIQLHT